MECHGLDTPERVCFYEQDFYVLSNFSSFQVLTPFTDTRFMTSEHAYHWCRFTYNLSGFGLHPSELGAVEPWRRDTAANLRQRVASAVSAHEAFRLAQDGKQFQRPDWNDIKTQVMKLILLKKAEQHEYVRRKLLATGDRELVENSWRDDFWGWGPSQNGQNMLGKLWMEVREQLRRDAKSPWA